MSRSDSSPKGQGWKHYFTDSGFFHLIEGMENIVSKILSVAMIIVILVALINLILSLIADLASPPTSFFNRGLIEIFGIFLDILIALEILENITAYLQKHVVQVELVIVTALIAVSRKLIIFDFSKGTAQDLIGLGAAIAALAFGYWIVRRSTTQPPPSVP